jgi:hypothetical protein
MEAAMQSQEIPIQQWRTFLDEFTKAHEGELISIEVQGKGIGAQTQASGVRLIGITFDPQSNLAQEIDVMVSNEAAHLMHAIVHPSQLSIARTDDGIDAALQVKSTSGPTTLVRFAPPSQTH